MTDQKPIGKEPPNNFVENVQKWVYIDTKLKEINKKTLEMRNMKNDLMYKIHEYVKENKLQNKKIVISDGELTLYEKREYPQLTFTYIHECLSEIIKDSAQLDIIMTHLKNSRKIRISSDIRRTYK
jgi:hypothetical protein